MRAGIFVVLALLAIGLYGGVAMAVETPSPAGPGISDSELFSILDLDRPGLERTKAAVTAGDLAGAKHEFAEYLRHRDKPVWSFDGRTRPQHASRPEGIDTSEADRTLRRELLSVSVYHKFDGEIDWTLNPINYREWPWQLNRHAFWITLGTAYWETGDEKYAREFVYQMTDWVKKCPVPDRSANSSETWRTIEAGIRTAYAWPESFYRFLTSPSFTDEAMITMVKSFVEHARYLSRWPTTGNWLTMEADGLMHIGVLFPEFKEAAEWRKTATDRLYAELDKQVYPDGAQIELTTGYHQVSLGNFLRAWEIAKKNEQPMPADYVARIERMFDYNLKAAMPDGALPGLNDASRTKIRPSLQNALNYFPARKDFEWVATSGASGTRPAFDSISMPFAGHLVMRSGWENDDRYLLLDAGPFGYGHQHEDKLSFVLYAFGANLLVDAGNYPYDSSENRRYVLSTRSHNTIMVDGLEQSRRNLDKKTFVVEKPLPNKWIASPEFDYAAGVYSEGYGAKHETQVTHARHIFFVRPDYWMVTDFLTPADDKSHRYESLFHVDVPAVKADETTKAARTENPDGANLSIVPLADNGLKVSVVAGQEKPVFQGWIPMGGMSVYKVRPIPTPIYEREQSGPTSFLYAFYPTAKGAACPIVAVEPLKLQADPGVQATAAAIRFADGHVDYFLQAATAAGKIRFGEFKTDAEAAYVQMKNGKIAKAYLAGGTQLTRAGKRVPATVHAIEDLSRTELRHQK